MPEDRPQGLVLHGRRRDPTSPRSLGAISLAGRERPRQPHLRHQLQPAAPRRPGARQRQDHPGARRQFRGAGWNVIKVVWGSYWDPLLARDTTGMLRQLMMETVDGEYQNCKAFGGAYTREHFFGKYPETAALVANMTDDDIWRLNRGGHDPHKVYAAYDRGDEAQGPADRDPGQDRQGLRHGRGRRSRSTSRTSRRRWTTSAMRHVPRPLQHPGHRRHSSTERAVLPPGRGLAGSRSTCKERRAALGGSLPQRRAQGRRIAASAGARRVRAPAQGQRRARDLTTMAFVQALNITAARQGRSARASCRSSPTRRAPSAWKACSARSASMRRSARSTSRSTPTS